MDVLLTSTTISLRSETKTVTYQGCNLGGADVVTATNDKALSSVKYILTVYDTSGRPVFAIDLADITNQPDWTSNARGANNAIRDITPVIGLPCSSGGGGQVDTVGAGPGIDVDSTDPVNPIVSARVKNSVEIDADEIQLVGDEASPGNGEYYGTDGSGTKGFYPLPAPGTGDVVGPASSVNNNIVLFGNTTGKLIKDAGINLSEIIEEDPGAGIGLIESGAGVSPIILKNIKDGQGTQVVNNTGSVQTDIHFSAADQYFYSDISGNPLEGTITAAGRALIDDADTTAQRATLGLTYSAKGTLVSASAANTPAQLAVGSDNQVLRSRASASTGLAWEDSVYRILIHPQANTLTNQPNTAELLTPAIPGIFTTKADLTLYRQAKIMVHVLTASASGNSPRIILRYSTTYSLTVGSYLDIGTSEVSASFSSAGVIESAWIDLVAGAKANVYINAVTDGGNGSADPLIVMTTALFR